MGCGSFPSVKNAEIVAQPNNRDVGAERIFECLDGYESFGEGVYTCVETDIEILWYGGALGCNSDYKGKVLWLCECRWVDGGQWCILISVMDRENKNGLVLA